MIGNALQSWALFWLAVLYLTFKITVSVWPAGWWLSVERVLVFDGVADAEIIMDVDRTIHREFVADWSVVVREYQSGAWVVACTARGTSNYKPDAALPDPLTLDWWTDGACPRLGPGRYIVSTIWTVRGSNALPEKVIQSASNTFEIREE
jgi:hypothetical protein